MLCVNRRLGGGERKQAEEQQENKRRATSQQGGGDNYRTGAAAEAAARSDSLSGWGWEPADQRAAKESVAKDFSGGPKLDRSGERADERDSAARRHPAGWPRWRPGPSLAPREQLASRKGQKALG